MKDLIESATKLGISVTDQTSSLTEKGSSVTNQTISVAEKGIFLGLNSSFMTPLNSFEAVPV